MPENKYVSLSSSLRYLFWSDWGSVPKLERATLAGTHRQAIVASSNLVWPNDLYIDYFHSRLYWTDAYTDRVESVDFNGGNRIMHASLSVYGSFVMHPYSLTIFQPTETNKHVYFTDWYRNYILFSRLNRRIYVPRIVFRNQDAFPSKTQQISQLRLLHSSNQPENGKF